MHKVIGDYEWVNRLRDAVLNAAPLTDMTVEEFAEFFIELLNGKADQLRGKQMPKSVKKITLPTDTAELMSKWYAAQAQLAELKNEEAQLRTAIVLQLFTASKLEGVETIDVGNGWRLKATKNLNVTATNASGQTIALLDAVGAINRDLAMGLVKWKPEVAMKPYRDLIKLAEEHPELNVVFANCITVKPGMPELEVIPPEAPDSVPVVESGVTITGGSNIKF